MLGHDTKGVSGESVEPKQRSATGSSTPIADPADVLIRTCPICGKTLHERKCKLFCPDPKCNYFVSCADYY